MGSKTPPNSYHQQNDDSLLPNGSTQSNGEPRGLHTSRDGDGCLQEGGTNDEEDDIDGLGREVREVELPNSAEGTNQKRKPNKSRKSRKKNKKQSLPHKTSLSDIFPSGQYLEGELQYYDSESNVTKRSTVIETRYNDRCYWKDQDFLSNYRKAAEVHRRARQWAQEAIKPGQTTESIVTGIEDSVRAMLGNEGLGAGDNLKSGLGFPTGLCLNHQVAHYTPNPGQKEVVLCHDDVVTIDFGVHINGWIVDSAFTIAFDQTYDNLLAAVKDATNNGIKNAGVDVRISDVSAAIQETMESYEVEIRGKTFPVKPIRNITGHNIKQFRIHGGKSIPFVKNSDQTKMEEGEVFAIETFGSTGRGYIVDDVGIYGYGLTHNAPLDVPVALSSAKRLHRTIRENFGTLVFSRRYLERLGVEKYLAGMNCLVKNGIVNEYCPLTEIDGSYSAQFEHTFLLTETHKEIFSRGNDY